MEGSERETDGRERGDGRGEREKRERMTQSLLYFCDARNSTFIVRQYIIYL